MERLEREIASLLVQAAPPKAGAATPQPDPRHPTPNGRPILTLKGRRTKSA